MKHLACIFLAMVACTAEPRVEQDGANWRLANASLQATVDPAQGGWLSTLAGADGRAYAGGGMVYSDWGLFQPRGLVGSRGSAASVTHGIEGQRAWLQAEGRLRADAACEPAADQVAYTVRYSLGDDAELAVEVSLTPKVALDGTPAFLAALTQVSGVREWQACTLDGRINEQVAREGRCFETARTPLDPARPELQLVFGDGRRLSISGIEAEGCPLQNVFVHCDARGNGALFFGLLDGDSGGWPPGQTWRVRYRLRLLP